MRLFPISITAKKAKAAFGVLFFLGLTIFLTRNTWFVLAGKWLVSVDKPTPGADAIALLVGDALDRPRQAAALFKQGVAQEVWFVETGDSPLVTKGLLPTDRQVYEMRLIAEGVPPNHIRWLRLSPPASSTLEEVRALRTHLEKRSPTGRLVVVTSWSHTGRARWTFNKVFQGTTHQIQLVAAEEETGPTNWWKSESGFTQVYLEYLKWLYYLLHHSLGWI